MLTVNGEVRMAKDGQTLSHFLEQQGYEISRVAVERNGQIVPKSQYETTLLEEGDQLEIVSFVGGG